MATIDHHQLTIQAMAIFYLVTTSNQARFVQVCQVQGVLMTT